MKRIYTPPKPVTEAIWRSIVIGLIVIALLLLILVATSSCTTYKGSGTIDGEEFSFFIMYPPGKKISLTNLELGKLKLGSADTEQPGPGEYTQSMFQMMQMMQMMYGLTPVAPSPVVTVPLRSPEGDDQ